MAAITSVTTAAHDGTWRNDFGNRRRVPDRWREARLVLTERGDGARERTFGLIVRAYDDGVALRYDLPKSSGLGRFVLTDELTEVRFAADHRCWAGGESGSAETQYPESQLSAVPRGEPGRPFRSVLPLLVETPAGYLAVAESDVLDWAGMSITGTGGSAVKMTLDPRADGNGWVVSSVPRRSPWRVLMFGRTAAEIAGSEPDHAGGGARQRLQQVRRKQVHAPPHRHLALHARASRCHGLSPPGGFINRSPAAFKPGAVPTEVVGTRARQLAMTVVYPSPLLVLSDSPKNYQGQKGIDFLRDIPTVWDESVVVSGEVGKSIVVARRAGGRWYLAAMNGDAAAELSVPLSFLSAGAWSLRAFADQPDGSDAQAVIESTRPISPGSALRLSLAPGGGFAGIISEAKTGR